MTFILAFILFFAYIVAALVLPRVIDDYLILYDFSVYWNFLSFLIVSALITMSGGLTMEDDEPRIISSGFSIVIIIIVFTSYIMMIVEGRKYHGFPDDIKSALFSDDGNNENTQSAITKNKLHQSNKNSSESEVERLKKKIKEQELELAIRKVKDCMQQAGKLEKAVKKAKRLGILAEDTSKTISERNVFIKQFNNAVDRENIYRMNYQALCNKTLSSEAVKKACIRTNSYCRRYDSFK